MATTAVIDYGMGNLHSVASAIHFVDNDQVVHVTDKPELILGADRVIFPGVGAIRDCMAAIKEHHIHEVLTEALKTKPVLGICVGMQALMSRSEENGGVDCLNILDGQVVFFGENHLDKNGDHLKVPHMGWSQVQQTRSHPLWQDIAQDTRFYFVHSYAVQSQNRDIVCGQTHYGKDFDAAIAKDNLFAVQFHPEKSHQAGLQLITNFLKWDGNE